LRSSHASDGSVHRLRARVLDAHVIRERFEIITAGGNDFGLVIAAILAHESERHTTRRRERERSVPIMRNDIDGLGAILYGKPDRDFVRAKVETDLDWTLHACRDVRKAATDRGQSNKTCDCAG
jgi:hypothetical protein